ncbi:MgtC/SapB family protein [Ethanoligenens sp.]|uniref:MgtC/SapB family protein n=1 Tax=Ethanoligenens sp. TaxID=2099655 RepID=UPI0039E7A129
MGLFYTLHLNLILRVLAAGLCGALIGYERKNRMKEAGIRTHFIVAMGAALMMVVSKYGFFDLVGTHSMGIDPTRVAAQIVSGIGFLGAGVIFVQRKTVIGLTTAAGLWTTAGIGMAIGAGMYEVGFAGAVIVVLAQMLLHKPFPMLASPKIRQLTLRVKDEKSSRLTVMELLRQQGILTLNYRETYLEDCHDEVEMELSVRLPKNYEVGTLVQYLHQQPYVFSLDVE